MVEFSFYFLFQNRCRIREFSFNLAYNWANQTFLAIFMLWMAFAMKIETCKNVVGLAFLSQTKLFRGVVSWALHTFFKMTCLILDEWFSFDLVFSRRFVCRRSRFCRHAFGRLARGKNLNVRKHKIKIKKKSFIFHIILKFRYS